MNLHVPGREWRPAFTPVVFRYKDAWHVGVINKWIRASDGSWIAHIVHGLHGDHSHFDYRDDGSIIPMELDLSGDAPLIRPKTKTPSG